MASNIASSGLWQNVILTIDCTIDYAKRVIGCDDLGLQIGDVADPHSYLMLMMHIQYVGPLYYWWEGEPN